MRKAFDANVPLLKPRLRGTETVPLTSAEPEQVPETPVEPLVARVKEPAASSAPPFVAQEERVERAFANSSASKVPPPAQDVQSRRERLQKIKRRVAEAAKPAARVEATPADPAQAAESVLSLVKDLEKELVAAREREEALRSDLESTRTDLSRAVGEGRSKAEKLITAESELEDKRKVLSEMLSEMGILEEERDEAVRRAQALSAIDEDRARVLEEVTRRADEESRAREEREAEVEALSADLQAGAAESARLRAAIGELARERDQLSSDLDRAKRERDELAAAKGALEQVHAALAQARARLG